MAAKRARFTVKVTYFKPSGKFYADGEFSAELADCGPDGHPSCYMNDAVDWVRRASLLPGLASSRWEGPVLLTCEEGYPVLLPGGV